jgi:hypothetical protein
VRSSSSLKSRRENTTLRPVSKHIARLYRSSKGLKSSWDPHVFCRRCSCRTRPGCLHHYRKIHTRLTKRNLLRTRPDTMELSASLSGVSRSTGKGQKRLTSSLLSLLLVAGIPSAMAQNQCVPLKGSTACPAFNSSSVSTGPALRGLL